MKHFHGLVLLIVMSAAANAQVNCQTYGNTTNCNGSLGPGISPLGPTDYSSYGQGPANAQAAQQLMQAQAQLAAAQAQAIQQQNEILRQQQVALAQQRWVADLVNHSIDELLEAKSNLRTYNCVTPNDAAACSADQPNAYWATQAINGELARRAQGQAARQAVEPANIEAGRKTAGDDNDSDYACGAAQTFCRQGTYMCGVYRRDFIASGRSCAGVTTP